jgi:DNA polymerase-3 subunit beta
MEITCGKKELQKAASLSEKIAGNNPTLPVLNAVLLSAKKNLLSFSSTNLETGLEILIPARVKKEGKIAVPAKLFSSFVNSLVGDENIEIKGLNNGLILTTNNSSTNIKGYPVDDFPILPKTNEKKHFIVSVNDFILGLKSVYYSASLSEIKPEINSIFVFASKKTPLTFAATDSFRLSEKIIHYNFSNSPSFLIPHRSVVEILRIFEDRVDDLNIKIDDNNLVLETSNIRFTTRLIDGNFPDYKQLIPTKFTNTVVLDKKQFNNALKTTTMFCGKLNEVKIKIYKNENFIETQSNNPELGEHTVNIPCKKIDGEDLTVVFNHRYLVDCLPSLNSEQIILKFSGEGKPLTITGLDDTSFCYLIMPMKNI